MKHAPVNDPERPLNIAVLGSTYPRSQDDYEVPWLRESVNRIAARGHRVTVLAPSYAGLPDHFIDGVQVKRFRYSPGPLEKLTHGEGAPNKLKKKPLLKLLTMTYVLSGTWSAWRLCQERKIDLLHVHWPFPHGVMALLPGSVGGVKVVSTCHSAELALAAQSEVSTKVLAVCLRRSDAVTANSRHTASLVHNISGVEALVIPYGATVQIPEKAGCDQEKDLPLLLFSGRLIARKGVQYLLEAMPSILAKRKVRLVVTGDGHCRAEWEALSRQLGIAHQVKFLGFVSKEELSELFRSCTAYVHPAIYDERGDTEGLGVVLIEALCNAKPVVATRVGGITDVIQNERTGLLVPEKNPKALADAVLRILDDPALAQRLGEAGRAYASSNFDWEKITDQVEALYRRVCAPGQSSLSQKMLDKSVA